MTDDVSPEVVARRVRNRIIECLELASSFASQRGSQLPAAEIMEIWADWVREPVEEWYRPPTYTEDEQAAIIQFQAIWEDVADNTPDPLPELDVVQRLPEWERLRSAAEEALGVFRTRGKLPED